MRGCSIACVLTFISLSIFGNIQAQVLLKEGYIPNKGQFLSVSKEIYGKISIGNESDLILTKDGFEGSEKNKYGALKIEIDSIVLSEPSEYYYNYYLPQCPKGVTNVRSYSKIKIKGAKKGQDWELAYIKGQGWVERFISSEKSGTSTSKEAEEEVGYTKLLPHLSQGVKSTEREYPSSLEWGTYWGGGKFYTSEQARDDEYRNYKNLEQNHFSLTNSYTDDQGRLYISGKARIIDFPIENQDSSFFSPLDTSKVSSDAFFAKFNADGSLAWATYYGSSVHDEATLIGLNKQNEIFVAGSISHFPTPLMNEVYTNLGMNFPYWKNDFPVYNKEDAWNNSTGSMFMLKFDQNGNRLWASLYSQNQSNKDSSRIITRPLYLSIDSDDNIYVAGYYASVLFYTINGRYVSHKGKPFPVFTSEEAFLWPYDSLRSANGNISSSPNHDGGTDPFLMKLDKHDNVIWSTYLPFKLQIQGLACDSKNNIYFSARTNVSKYPATVKREGAYFASKTRNADNTKGVSYPFIGRINTKGELDWCTHIGGDESIEDYGIVGDMKVTKHDNIVITGTTSSKKFPEVGKDGAYYIPYDSTKMPAKENMFITEFDTSGKMIWSTIVARDSNSMGLKLCSDLNGGFFLSGIKAATTKVDQQVILQEKTIPFLCHFNKYGRMDMRKDLPIILSPLCWYNTYNFYYQNNKSIVADFEIINLGRVHVLPELSISISSYGKLFFTGNTLSMADELFKSSASAYRQREHLEKINEPLTGFILEYELCDTAQYAPLKMPIGDTSVCSNSQVSLHISLSSDPYSQHEILWNKGSANEAVGDEYTIEQTGKYYVMARNVFSRCPSVYGDTIEVNFFPPAHLSFDGDTIGYCISDSISFLSAGSEGAASYIWSDSTTDSTYSVIYKGEEYELIWCEITSLCQEVSRDTAWIKFLPPYAYLGQDTLLCNTDTLLLDAEFLNLTLPVKMMYTWSFNDTIVRGSDQKEGQYFVIPRDSGRISVAVHWPESQCKVARDTIFVDYYKYKNTVAFLGDSTVCSELGQVKFVMNIDSLSNSPDEKYLWRDVYGDSISNKAELMISDTGIYIAKASNYCSKSEDTIVFAYYPAWWTALSIPADTIMCEEETIDLDVSVIGHPTSYFWSDSVYTAYRTIKTPGEYALVLTDTAGCESIYDLNIGSESCAPKIEMANVFTPNDDGINDSYTIKTSEKIYDFKIHIYNRWGNEVYKYIGDPSDFKWKGDVKGSGTNAPDGVYFYIIKYRDYKNKNSDFSGSVTILR